jgi:hypothetical protein
LGIIPTVDEFDDYPRRKKTGVSKAHRGLRSEEFKVEVGEALLAEILRQ